MNNQTSPEDLFIKKHERKECRDFINEIFMSLNLEKIKIIERQIFHLTKNLEFFKEFYFLSSQALNFKQESLIPKINERIENSKWANHDLMRYFNAESHIQVGHKLDSIPDIEKINREKEFPQFVLEENKVCLIYIWTYYKSICKKQLRHLNELFEKNNWEGNVRFMTINYDLNRDHANLFLKQLNLTKMEHFYVDIRKRPEHPIYKFGEKQGNSTCILINHENVVDSTGTLYEIDLVKRINLMLERNLANSGNMTIPNTIDKNDKILLKKIIKNFEAFTQSQSLINVNNHITGGNGFSNNDNMHDMISENNNYLITPQLSAMNTNVCIKETSPVVSNFNDPSNNSGVIISKTLKNNKSRNSNTKLSNILNTVIEPPFVCDIKSYKLRLSKKLTLDLIKITVPHLCEVKIVLNKIFPTGNFQKGNINSHYSGEIEYQCHVNDEKEVLKLFSGIDEIKNLNIRKNIIETVEFSYGESCACCSCLLFEEYENEEIVLGQYFCPLCDIYFCKDCGNEITNVNSFKKLHNHFLFFLNNSTSYYMKYILKHNLENQSEFEFKYFLENKNFDYVAKDLKQHYHIKCDGCFSYPIKTYRWKCCNCEYKNVCETCMNIVERNSEPFASEISNNLELGGCDLYRHVFMKIIFEAPLYK